MDLTKCNFYAQNIIIENADIELTQDLSFFDRNRVAFLNCLIVPKKFFKISINFTAEVEFTNCTITDVGTHDSSYPFCELDYISKLTVKYNVFRNCFSEYGLFRETNYKCKRLNEATFTGNNLVNCRVQLQVEGALLASLQNCKYLKVRNNNFVDCHDAYQGIFIWDPSSIEKKEIRDNKLSGSVTKICNFEA